MIEQLFIPAIAVLGYMLAWYVVSLIANDASLVDIAWGLGFILIALLTLVRDGRFLPVQLLITLLILIWGLRLSYHIARRKLGKPEDWRYAAWRKSWGRWFTLRSLFQVFILQGLLLIVIALPIILTNSIIITNSSAAKFSWIVILGLLLWLKGAFWEFVGDWQLARFIADKRNKGKLMTTGLWKYTRHPNYFGESMMWWGVATIALGATGSWLVYASPVLLTFLLLFVSGIPMLEKKYAGRADWEAYKRRTSVFFPLPPRKA